MGLESISRANFQSRGLISQRTFLAWLNTLLSECLSECLPGEKKGNRQIVREAWGNLAMVWHPTQLGVGVGVRGGVE